MSRHGHRLESPDDEGVMVCGRRLSLQGDDPRRPAVPRPVRGRPLPVELTKGTKPYASSRKTPATAALGAGLESPASALSNHSSQTTQGKPMNVPLLD